MREDMARLEQEKERAMLEEYTAMSEAELERKVKRQARHHRREHAAGVAGTTRSRERAVGGAVGGVRSKRPERTDELMAVIRRTAALDEAEDRLREAWEDSGRDWLVLDQELKRLMQAHPSLSDHLIEYADELAEEEP